MTPDVQPLPYERRRWFFNSLALIFVLAVPIFIFYAAGYRIDLTSEESSIISVGGIYISAEADNVEIFINDDPVEDMRIFRRAAYIQNLPSGNHRIHVQGEGLHTWVKELPVFAHIVTEAAAFNMPLLPQVRLVSEFQTVDGESVVYGASTTKPLGDEVAYRTPWIATTSRATSTYVINPEHDYLKELFGTSTSTSTPTLLGRLEDGLARFNFSSEAPTTTVASSTATTTRLSLDRRLYEDDLGEIHVKWEGAPQDIPNYFCINHIDATTTALEYGEHIGKYMAAAVATEQELMQLGRLVCRDSIHIETEDQEVRQFAFFPDNADLVLLHLEDGLYAVEADDRGWQNKQLLYPGTDFTMVLDGNQIFLRDQGHFFELLTTLDA